MIEYGPCVRTRNDESMKQIKEGAMQRSLAAARVHECALNFIEAIQCLEGGNWDAHIDYESGLASFSRAWS